MQIDRGCYERGCACHMPLFDDDYVIVGNKEWVGLHDSELDKYTPDIRSIIRLVEAKLKERNT